MKKNQKYNKENIFPIIAAWQQSKQSQAKFCKDNQLSISTFQYWLKKYKESQSETQTPLARIYLAAQSDRFAANCKELPASAEMFLVVFGRFSKVIEFIICIIIEKLNLDHHHNVLL
jgi:hypothetical protein